MDGGDRVELCFIACQYYVSDVINRLHAQGVEEHDIEQLHTMLNLLRSLGPLV